MNDSTRTFRARFNITLDGAVLESRDHILTITGQGWEGITATLDGQPVSLLRAAQITEMALSMGSFEKISEAAPAPIGNRAGHALHVQLAQMGYGRGYAVASEALERPVSSLAALTLEEARAAWSYACSLAEMPTQPSILFAVVA